MNYALFPSPVYPLSSWLDFSNLLFIGLLSLPCFSPLILDWDLAALLLLSHYGLLPFAGKLGWTAQETHPSSWKSSGPLN